MRRKERGRRQGECGEARDRDGENVSTGRNLQKVIDVVYPPVAWRS